MGCTIPPFYSQAKWGESCYGIYPGMSPPTAITISFDDRIISDITLDDENTATIVFSE